jgi:hypothetical protein
MCCYFQSDQAFLCHGERFLQRYFRDRYTPFLADLSVEKRSPAGREKEGTRLPNWSTR